MNEADLIHYAKWLLWAHEPDTRQRVLLEYQNTISEHDAGRLQAIFDQQKIEWEKLTDVQREGYRNRQCVNARKKLHEVAA